MRRKRSKPEPDAQGGRETALRLLSRREHSAAELKYKLGRRGHEEGQAQEIVERLGTAGWQSDARYAEMLLRNRADRGYGPLRVRAELEAARVADAIIRAAFEAADVDWDARACAVHARRFGQPPQSAAEWQKQYRYLAARGFESGQIRTALKRDEPGAE
ncbi:regulatory protein RecX [Fontimonas sp. SYSU GA230001]|uniref:regulatory protein RecX n=1 Tax=Fontimonas sp. SYSU GA230001 TaxID=3142450 RepID=UPI0032B47137